MSNEIEVIVTKWRNMVHFKCPHCDKKIVLAIHYVPEVTVKKDE